MSLIKEQMQAFKNRDAFNKYYDIKDVNQENWLGRGSFGEVFKI